MAQPETSPKDPQIIIDKTKAEAERLAAVRRRLPRRAGSLISRIIVGPNPNRYPGGVRPDIIVRRNI